MKNATHLIKVVPTRYQDKKEKPDCPICKKKDSLLTLKQVAVDLDHPGNVCACDYCKELFLTINSDDFSFDLLDEIEDIEYLNIHFNMETLMIETFC